MYMNLTEDLKTVKDSMQVGRFVAVTDRFSHKSCYGTVTGYEGNRLVVKNTKGNTHTFSMTSGVWIFRYRNFEA